MKVLNWVLGMLFSMVLLIFFFTLGPWVESSFLPVYSHFELVSAEPSPDGTIAVFRYTKYRNCEPLGYTWFSGDIGAGVTQLNVRRKGSSGPRPLGTQTTAPINIAGITPLELADNVYAVLYSRCHPLWITETEVRP